FSIVADPLLPNVVYVGGDRASVNGNVTLTTPNGAASGTDRLQVDGAGRLIAGDKVTIDKGKGNAEDATVKDVIVSGGDSTLLGDAAKGGTRLYFDYADTLKVGDTVRIDNGKPSVETLTLSALNGLGTAATLTEAAAIGKSTLKGTTKDVFKTGDVVIIEQTGKPA